MFCNLKATSLTGQFSFLSLLQCILIVAFILTWTENKVPFDFFFFLISHSDHRFVCCHITISSITSAPVLCGAAKPCFPPLVVKPLSHQHLTTLITKALSEFISSRGNFCSHCFCERGWICHSIEGARKGLADDKVMSIPPPLLYRDYLICKVLGWFCRWHFGLWQTRTIFSCRGRENKTSRKLKIESKVISSFLLFDI